MDFKIQTTIGDLTQQFIAERLKSHILSSLSAEMKKVLPQIQEPDFSSPISRTSKDLSRFNSFEDDKSEQPQLLKSLEKMQDEINGLSEKLCLIQQPPADESIQAQLEQISQKLTLLEEKQQSNDQIFANQQIPIQLQNKIEELNDRFEGLSRNQDNLQDRVGRLSGGFKMTTEDAHSPTLQDQSKRFDKLDQKIQDLEHEISACDEFKLSINQLNQKVASLEHKIGELMPSQDQEQKLAELAKQVAELKQQNVPFNNISDEPIEPVKHANTFEDLESVKARLDEVEKLSKDNKRFIRSNEGQINDIMQVVEDWRQSVETRLKDAQTEVNSRCGELQKQQSEQMNNYKLQAEELLRQMDEVHQDINFNVKPIMAKLAPKLTVSTSHTVSKTDNDQSFLTCEESKLQITAINDQSIEVGMLTSQPDASKPKPDVLQSITMLLKSVPEGANSDCIKIWHTLKPLTVDDFENFWARYKQNDPIIDLDNSTFDEWEEFGKKRLGMRHKTSGKRHGIVRVVENNGSIYEATYRQGKMYGFYRWITDGQIRLQISESGQGKALLHFNTEFQEIARNDPQGLFANVKPENFKAE